MLQKSRTRCPKKQRSIPALKHLNGTALFLAQRLSAWDLHRFGQTAVSYAFMLLSEIRNKKLENSFTSDTVFIRDSVQFMQESLTDFSGIVLKNI